MIKDSGDRTKFETGAVRDMHEGKGRFDLLPWNAIHDVARHCEDGAKKYGEHNVDKGIPQHSLIDSGLRHLCRYINGETDEPHLRAAAWNILWALEQETTHPEMQDLPGKGKPKQEYDDTEEIRDAISEECIRIQKTGDCYQGKCKLYNHVNHEDYCFTTLNRDHLLEHYRLMFGRGWGE